jgi:phosphoglycerol transferase MdoB-like AlkP superfamily enzyme
MFADTIYYRAFEDFFSFYTFEQYKNLDNLSSSIFALIRLGDFVFFIDLLVFVIFFYSKKFSFEHKRNSKRFWQTFAFAIIYCFAAEKAHEQLRDQTLFDQSFAPTVTMSKLSIYGYYIQEVLNYTKSYFVKDMDKDEIRALNMQFKLNKRTYLTHKNTAALAGQNIIMLQIESLENFVINLKVEGQEVVPFLNSLTTKSIYFNNFYEQIKNGGSSDADFMAHTSIYPPRKSCALLSFGENFYFSLPYYLNNAHYKTIAIKQDYDFFYRWKSALTNMGFSKCYARDYFKNPEMINGNISDSSLLVEVARTLLEEPSKYFAFISTVSSHVPYELPKEKKYLNFSDDMNNSVAGKYFQAIRYTDEQLKLFFEKLQNSGALNNTAIVLYGDHTSLNRYFKTEVAAMQNLAFAKEALIKRVPLLIYSNHLTPNTNSTICGQIDLMPTLLNLIGLRDSVQDQYIFGRDIFNSTDNYAILSDGTVVGQKPTDFNPEAILDLCDRLIKVNYFKTKRFNKN